MALTHVCEWESGVGYKRISIREACRNYPYHGVSASSGTFVCELCAQNVLLTAPGINTRHFRHDPASPNKECEERQVSFDPTYGRSLRFLNAHAMPLKIKEGGGHFSLHIGFFHPPEDKISCDKIRIIPSGKKSFEYSFERIEERGTTYLLAGEIPAPSYSFEYVNAGPNIKKYWADVMDGVKESGTFFELSSGLALQQGGKAYAGHTYYLLQKKRLPSYHPDIEATEIAKEEEGTFATWYLYKIQVKGFTEYAAKFFLRRSIFLTEKPTKVTPLWPPYKKTPYFIYHNANEFYFFLQGDDAVLAAYPATKTMLSSNSGNLYKLYTRDRIQLVSIGKSGALGFTYLYKMESGRNNDAKVLDLKITELDGTEITEDMLCSLPKDKAFYVFPSFDGKVVLKRKEKTVGVIPLKGGERKEVGSLVRDMEIFFYQGLDLVRKISIKKEDKNERNLDDKALLSRLQRAGGPMVPVTHQVLSIGRYLSGYQKTGHWLRRRVNEGEIPRFALKELNRLVEVMKREEL